MAEQYTVVGSSSTIRVLSATQAIDVEAIQIETKPSAVRLTVQVPLSDFRNDTYDGYLLVSAQHVEALLAIQPAPGQYLAVAAYQSQDTDSAGLIAYFISFLASYTPSGPASSPLTEWVTFPWTVFETNEAFDVLPTPETTLKAAYARLVAAAAK